ncbi:hypothetical protein FRC01_002287, partial [Tulasnella sp. 417]
PEVLNGEEPDLASGIWALGWICWEIATDNYPFPDISSFAQITLRVVQGQLPSVYDEGQLSQIRRHHAKLLAISTGGTTFGHASTVPTRRGFDETKIRSAALLLSLVEIQLQQSRYREAVPILEDTLALAGSMDDAKGIADALYRLGIIYQTWARYSEAQEYLNEALFIYTGIGYTLRQANSLGVLGAVSSSRSQYATAKGYFDKALALFAQLGNVMGEGNILQGLGNLYMTLAKYVEADRAFSRLLAIHT